MPHHQVPTRPKIYHIVHVDRLASIAGDGALCCDVTMMERPQVGTSIGLAEVKARHARAALASHPELRVGDCVPFYFCPRSVMLYLLYQGNYPGLTYRKGQGLIVHLEADLRESVAWAERVGRRWAFTASNAGSYYFHDWSDLAQLHQIDWVAVRARYWQDEHKRNENRLSFSWNRHSRGVSSPGSAFIRHRHSSEQLRL